MADITDQHDQTSPHDIDDANSVGNGSAPSESRGVKRQRPTPADDDDDDDEKGGRERRKIEIKFISDKSRRHITFSKRKAGIMKKAYELSVLTGTQVLLLVVSETGLVYTFTTPKLQPLVTKAEGKNLIQVRSANALDSPLVGARTPATRSGRVDPARHTTTTVGTVQEDVANMLYQACLNAPEPAAGGENGVDGGDGGDSPEESGSHIPPPSSRPGMPQNPHMPGNYMPNMPLEAQQAMAYQNYVQRNQGYTGMPQQPGMAPSSHHQS
ncbi:hypothetical protein V2A60_010140 [Cordyceps javanica]